MEQGQELIAMVSSSNDDGGGGGGGGSEWETGDCARDESTTAALLQNAGKYEVASRGGCDCAKLSAVNVKFILFFFVSYYTRLSPVPRSVNYAPSPQVDSAYHSARNLVGSSS